MLLFGENECNPYLGVSVIFSHVLIVKEADTFSLQQCKFSRV